MHISAKLILYAYVAAILLEPVQAGPVSLHNGAKLMLLACVAAYELRPVLAARPKGTAFAAVEAAARQRLSDAADVPLDVDDITFRSRTRLEGNARPGDWERRTRVSPEMLRHLTAYAYATLFTCQQMHCQVYCAFWIYDPWLSNLLIIVRFYGWAIASLIVGAGGGHNDGGRGYLRNTELTGAGGALFANELLSSTALNALAVFLKCDVVDLPGGLRQVPHYGDMYSVAYVALVDFMPLLKICICCHNCCKSACRRRGLCPLQTIGICAAMIYTSLPMVCATYFLELDPVAAFGHAVGAELLFVHVFHFPTVLIGGRILCIYVRNDKERLHADTKALCFTVYLKALAQAGVIPLLGILINPELTYKAFSSMYDVALGVAGACGVPTRAGITCSTIAYRASQLLLKDADGCEYLFLCPPPNLLLYTYRLADDYISGLLGDLLRKGKMAARPGGELAIFHHLVERGAYQPEFVGRRGALLERLIVRGGSGSALRVGHAFNSEIFSMLGARPWDGKCVEIR